MTNLSHQILQNYQVRKTAKQKAAFRELLQEHFPQMQVQKGGFPKSHNVIIGDVEQAKIVLSAHYDTCPQLPVPNFIAPKHPILSVAYSIAILVPLFIAFYLINAFLNLISDAFWLNYGISLAIYLGSLGLIIFGPANKRTANDNTSGVIALCEILAKLPPEAKDSVAVVFFDNEELGLVGSTYFRKVYKTQMQDKLLINFDCISDGDHILLSVSKDAMEIWKKKLSNCFQNTDDKEFLIEDAEKTYYPSDQIGFKNAIAVAALKRHKRIGYYMDRIHTAKDTAFDDENIDLLCMCTLELIKTPL